MCTYSRLLFVCVTGSRKADTDYCRFYVRALGFEIGGVYSFLYEHFIHILLFFFFHFQMYM